MLRQRDIMHRLMDVEQKTAGEGASAAGATPQLKLGLSTKNLATFNTPIHAPSLPEPAGVEVGRARKQIELVHQRSARAIATSPRGRAIAKRWRVARAAAYFVGDYKVRQKQGSAKVAPASVPLTPAKKFAGMEKDPVARRAATKIQATYRGKTTRDELYWEMMGY